MIDVKHLSKSFGEVEVLKDINETIEKGEKVVIVRSVRLRKIHLSPLS